MKPLIAAKLRLRWSLQVASAALVFVVGALFATLALWGISHTFDKSHANQAGALAAATARVATEGLERELESSADHLRGAAAMIVEDRLWEDPQRLQRRLAQVQLGDRGFSWVGVTDAAGQVIAATAGMALHADVSRRDWFLRGSEGLHFGDVHEAVLLNNLLPPLPGGEPWRFVDIAIPLVDADRKLRGVLAVHLSWPWLRDTIARVGSLGEGSQVWLLGVDNLARLSPDGRTAPLQLQAVERARLGGLGWMVEPWPDGRRYVTGYSSHGAHSPMAELGWVTLVRTPADSWPAAARHQFAAYALSSLALVMLLSAWAWYQAGRQLRPLRAFIRTLANLRIGQQPPHLPASAPQEFDELNEAIARLVERLNARKSELRDALEDMRHSFRAVGRGIPGVLATLRSHGQEVQFSYVGETAHRYLGVAPEELMHDTSAWLRNAEPQGAQALDEAFRQMRASGGQTLRHTCRIRGGDGIERTLQTLLVRRDPDAAHRPDDAEDGATEVYDCISLDITELVAVREQAERANRAKSDFLATMSHELRTPLNAILGFSRVLEDTLADREQQRQARFIRETGEMLTRILNDVLDLAKVESGKFTLDPRPFSLEQVIEACRTIYRVVAAEKGLSFNVDVQRDLPTLVGDPVRLRQVLENLLSNAFKFTSSGGVSLRATLERLRELPEGGREALLRISVTDTGIGMTAEQVSRSFQRFEQADRSVANRYGGTGLGLSIVKALVGRMGGEIDLLSHEGRGTEVVLMLPFGLDNAGMPTTAQVDLAAPEAPLHVLVADDVAVNRLLIRAWLEMRGHQVSEAGDGVEAIQRVREQRPDLVLMDLDMPNVDGLEATRRLRAQELPGERLPIYALSGKAFAEDIADAEQAGMDGHLPKPVTLEELVRVLRSVPARRPVP